MATWVRSFTANLTGTANLSLVGPADLDTDTSPADFDAAGVTAVQFQFTLSHTGTFGTGTQADLFALQSTEIQTSGSVQLAAVASTGTITDGTATVVVNLTDNAPNTGASTADWEGARFESQATNIATFSQTKGPDGVTPQILAASVTITITYTPATGTDYTETVTELVGVTDSVSRIVDFKRAPVEPVGVTDDVTAAKTITVEISDAVGVVDDVTDDLTGAGAAYVGSVTATADASSGSTLTINTVGSTGDLLIAVMICDVNTTSWTADDAGWTELRDTQHGTQSYTTATYWKIKAGGDPATFDFTSVAFKSKVGTIAAFSNAALLDDTYAEDSDNNTDYLTPDTATGAATDILFALAAVNSGSATITDPASMTEAVASTTDGSGNMTFASSYEQLASTAAPGTRTFTSDTSATSIGVSFRIEAAAAAGTDYTETVTEPVGVTDSVARTVDYERTSTETVGVTDSTTAAKSVPVAVTDPVGVTDSVTASKSTSVEVSEPVGVTDDTVAAKTAALTVTEPVGVTDSVATQMDKARTVTDPVGVTDSVTAAKTITVDIVDPVGVTDAVSEVLQVVHTAEPVDPVGVTDLVVRIVSANRTVTESVGLTDLVTAAKLIAVSITDPVGVIDDVTAALSKSIEVVDAVGVTDSTVAAKSVAPTVTEAVGVVDDVSAAKTIAVTVTDGVGVTDVVVDDLQAGGTDYTETVTDPVGVTDSVSAAKSVPVTVTDPVGVTDSVSAAKTVSLEIVDPVGVTDSVGSAKSVPVTVTDPVGVTDDVTAEKSKSVEVTDAVGVTDSLVAAKTINVTITDAVGVTDATAGGFLLEETITDSVGVTDSVVEINANLDPIEEFQIFYFPFKGHNDPVSLELNQTAVETFLNYLNIPEAGINADGSVTSIKLATTVQSDNFVTGVSGWQIERVTGSAEFQDVVVRGDLNADDITAGTLVVDRISAGTITTEKLVKGSFDNLIQDPGFESNSQTNHRFSDGSGGTFAVGTAGVERSGDYACRWTANGGSGIDDSVFGNLVATSCAAGDTHYASVWLRPDGSFNRTVQLRIRYFKGASLIQDTGVAPSLTASTWNQLEHATTAPATADSVEIRVRVVTAVASAGALDIDDMEFRRKVGTLVINDQAVDIDRMLDPVYTETAYTIDASDTISSSAYNTVDATLTIPSWVGTASVMATAQIWRDTWGTTQNLFMWCIIGGTDGPHTTQDVISGEADVFSTTFTRTVTSPGSTIVAQIEHRAGTSDQTLVYAWINAIAVGLR